MVSDKQWLLDVNIAYLKGKVKALDEVFSLAKEKAYDDGVDYSISLQVLDELIERVKGVKNDKN